MKTNFTILTKLWQKNKEERLVYGHIKPKVKLKESYMRKLACLYIHVCTHVSIYFCVYTYMHAFHIYIYILPHIIKYIII